MFWKRSIFAFGRRFVMSRSGAVPSVTAIFTSSRSSSDQFFTFIPSFSSTPCAYQKNGASGKSIAFFRSSVGSRTNITSIWLAWIAAIELPHVVSTATSLTPRSFATC